MMCDELKAISGNEIREDIDYNTRGIDPENKEWCNYGKELCDTLYYRKSEADEVIAELKNENERLKKEASCTFFDDCLRLRQTKRKLRHSKYKRCLAMALWCSAEIGILDFFCGPKIKYYKRWQKRWLKLAEHFKPEAR